MHKAALDSLGSELPGRFGAKMGPQRGSFLGKCSYVGSLWGVTFLFVVFPFFFCLDVSAKVAQAPLC